MLSAGYELVFFDQEHDLDRMDRTPELLAELDDCLAAFVWLNEAYPFTQFANATMLSAGLKSSHPDVPVIVGGEMITICPTGYLDMDMPVDFFLQGYGEESSLRLLEHLEAGTQPDDVPGLVWHDAAGSFHHRPPDAKALFRPDFLQLYHRVDLSPYVQDGGVFGNGIPTLTVATGRGCTKGCPFCCWSSHPSRVLGAESTFELLASLRDRYGVRQFHIGELDFFMSQQRALELADLIHEHRPDIGWYALGSPSDLLGFSDADWDRLRVGGLLKVEMGSESGSTRVLRSIGKSHDADDIFDISVKMLERDIVPMNNFLFGFPGETHEDRADTIRLVNRLVEAGAERNHFTYRHYQPVVGTEVGDKALAHATDMPQRLDRFLATRPDYASPQTRTMPWLPADGESELKYLVSYDLPLATSQLAVPSRWRRAVYHALRGRARRTLRSGGRWRPPTLDRWIYDWVFGQRLNRTYIP